MVWATAVGSGPLEIDGDFTTPSAHNWFLGSGLAPQSGQRVIVMGNVETAPSSLASLVGGIIYVESGHLLYLGAGGTLTNIGSS